VSDIINRLLAARKILGTLCSEGRPPSMSIPPRPDKDEDLIICNALNDARDEITQLRAWIFDLQAGCYVNCVYCGRRYGPDATTPTSMADVLKAHVEQCSKHPLAQANADIAVLAKVYEEAREATKYQSGGPLVEACMAADDAILRFQQREREKDANT